MCKLRNNMRNVNSSKVPTYDIGVIIERNRQEGKCGQKDDGMTEIAVCDDRVEQTEELQQYITGFCDRENVEYHLNVYTSGEALLEDVERMEIIFLDIEMPQLDGIATGKAIRAKNRSCKIIMATCMVERMKEAFYIEAFRFVTKPFDQKEVEEALEACLREMPGNRNMELYYMRNRYQVRQSEISYIVTYDSYCEYLVGDKILRSETSLRELEKELDSRLFYRIHRKYIINMAKIESYRNGKVKIKGDDIPVSRRRKKEFEQAYMEFDLKYR